MSQVTRAASKLKFETGDRPTQSDFGDLHDSVAWYDEIPSVPTPDLDDIDIYQLLGSQVVAEPIGLSAANISNNTSMADGSLYIIGMKHKRTRTINGVLWFANGGGTPSYTADNYNGVGLYTYSAGVLTLIRSSADDGNIWKPSIGTWTKKAFSSAYTNAPAGVYFVGLLYNSSAQVVGPSICQTTSMNGGAAGLNLDFTNSVKVHGLITGQASLPSSLNMSSLAGAPTQRIYVALY